MSQSGFWNDRASAEALSREVSDLKSDLDTWEGLNREGEELSHLVDDADAESIRSDIEQQLGRLEATMSALEFRILLSDRYDERNAIVAIHAGTGGTDAQDWAGMLLRMYLRYCEQQGWRTRVLDESRGQEAGVKSVTFEVTGRLAYGYLKNEAGVHRLVRISPFDAEKMRHTSFALVEALPEIAEVDDNIKIDPKDLRIDTFLSSGHGGQSVQTTYPRCAWFTCLRRLCGLSAERTFTDAEQRNCHEDFESQAASNCVERTARKKIHCAVSSMKRRGETKLFIRCSRTAWSATTARSMKHPMWMQF